MNLPDAIMYHIVRCLGSRDRLHLAWTSSCFAQPLFHACLYAPLSPHRNATLARSLHNVTRITSRQWKTLAHRMGRRKRKRLPDGRLSWKEALRPTGCLSCGLRTQRTVFGHCLCLYCTSDPRKKRSFCVPKYRARRFVRQVGLSPPRFRYHPSSMGHLIPWLDIVEYCGINDSVAVRRSA